MFSVGAKYQHLLTTGGCACHTPGLARASSRLADFSRRGFLAGLCATIAAGRVHAQPATKANPILLRGARVFDGRTPRLIEGGQVLIEGDRIVAVDRSGDAPPDGARVIDCGGRVLMPGLIDAHWHAVFAAVPAQILAAGDPGYIYSAAVAEAERTLMRGFTTVRDVGGPVFSFKQAIDDGVVPGPRIYPSGAMITTSGGHGDLRSLTELPRTPDRLSTIETIGGAMIADSAGELQLRVREQLLQGASQIKITGGGGVSSPRSPLDMTSFSLEDLKTAVAVASDWNTYVTVHAYTPRTIRRAIDAGAGCIEHAHLIDEETAKVLADKGLWLSTQPFLSEEDSVPLTGPGRERLLQVVAGSDTIYGFARKLGIKTAFGSDMLFSPTMTARQGIMLTHLTRWYGNAEILTMATATNAELLALSGPRNPYPAPLGVVEKGAFADLLLVDGDPLADIHLLERPEETLSLIMKNGAIYKNTLAG